MSSWQRWIPARKGSEADGTSMGDSNKGGEQQTPPAEAQQFLTSYMKSKGLRPDGQLLFSAMAVAKWVWRSIKAFFGYDLERKKVEMVEEILGGQMQPSGIPKISSARPKIIEWADVDVRVNIHDMHKQVLANYLLEHHHSLVEKFSLSASASASAPPHGQDSPFQTKLVGYVSEYKGSFYSRYADQPSEEGRSFEKDVVDRAVEQFRKESPSR